MKRILLLSANRFCDPYPVYPLGVSYLKTYLTAHLSATEYEVQILDCNMLTNDELYHKIVELHPFFVGVSLRNVDGANSLDEGNFIDAYAEVIAVVRRATNAHVSIGGAGFSIFPHHFMAKLQADSGIVGEGEQSLCQLIENLAHNRPLTDIEGLILPHETAPRQSHTHYVNTLDVMFEDDLVDYYWRYSGMLNIQTKRGCPYHCIYCSYPGIDGCRVRTLDVEKIVTDMARLKRDKHIDYFFFTDSVFNINNAYNVALAERLVAEHLDIHWGAYFSPHNLSEEHLQLFQASGLTHVEFGTESLCDETLAAYGKLFTFDDVKHVSDLCVKYGVYYAHFLILGGYGETHETLRTTIEHSKVLQSTVFFPYIGMRIYPRTKLHEIAVAQGVVAADDMLVEPRYYIAPDFSLDEARALAQATDKAWIFPDEPHNALMDVLRLKRNKKGPLWEYLRRP
ncbi:MAG: lipid biosynthesis B12-binding/radical SAM protein [Paludibacteraceae bacterium]